MSYPELRLEDIITYVAKWLKIEEEAKKNAWVNGCNNVVKFASEQGPGDQKDVNED